MRENHPLSTLDVRVSDITFHTVLDTGFLGTFGITTEVHSHMYFEIQAAISGIYSIEFSNKENAVQMETDSFCLIPPGCFHSAQSASADYEKLALRFSYVPNERSKTHSPIYSSLNSVFSKITIPLVAYSPELCRLMLQIRNEIASNELGVEIIVQQLLGQFYIKLLRLFNSYDGSSKLKSNDAIDTNNFRYSQIEWFFGEHFSEPITEQDLANELMLSKRQVSRILKKMYNMSFREKLIGIRMSNAAKLLTHTDLPISKIAEKVGYSTNSGFYTTFKKHYAISGLEYRKNNKK